MSSRRRRSGAPPAISLDPTVRGSDPLQLTRRKRSADLVEDGGTVQEKLLLASGKVDPATLRYPWVDNKIAWIGLALLALSILWAFLPSWSNLVQAWEREPDYSHGWFVIPIVAYLMWTFRDTMPPLRAGFHPGGLVMLVAVLLCRLFFQWAYLDFADGWMIPLTVISISWVIGGWAFAVWAFPMLMFLFFMVPLPFRLENELSRPLQWIATHGSASVLQLFGQPAISQGTTILLGENTLEVERACSGLRIFMGVFALAYVYAMLARRTWWEGLLIVLAAIPIALIANMSRIVITGLCYQWLSGEAAKKFSHDLAGYFMIVLAGSLFGMFVFYLRWLIQDAQTMDQVALRRA